MNQLLIFATAIILTAIPLFAGPVSDHGDLQVLNRGGDYGYTICDESGNPYQLKGFSALDLKNWDTEWVVGHTIPNIVALTGSNAVRIAMYTYEASHGYMNQNAAGKALYRQKMKDLIEDAILADIYILIDWHILNDPNPWSSEYYTEAYAFFTEIAEEYGSYDNVLFELGNEPLDVSFAITIKPWAEHVLSGIRLHSDNLVTVGTPNWSQTVGEVKGNQITHNVGRGILYNIHFYAATHGQWLRDAGNDARWNNVPLIISEFGTVDATGNGILDLTESGLWLDWADTHNYSWFNWSLSIRNETSAALINNDLAGPWYPSDFSASGRWILDRLGSDFVDLTNIAYGKNAWMSSTHTIYYASNAVDGYVSGNNSILAQSAGGTDEWWMVDLGEKYNVSETQWFNRLDCCSDRMNNYSIQYSVDGNQWTTASLQTVEMAFPTIIPVNAPARYIRLQQHGNGLINFNEAQVFGSLAPLDEDSDGVLDNNDLCPNTPVNAPIDIDGCADSERDTDRDGVIDVLDECPNDASGITDLDGDGICDISDNDIDGDGVDNASDALPNDASETVDTDGDGIGNNADACDGTPSDGGTLAPIDANGCYVHVDSDGDTVPDFRDDCGSTANGAVVDSRGCEVLGDVEIKLEGESYNNSYGVLALGTYVAYLHSAYGDWFEYTNVNIPVSGTYTIEYRHAGFFSGTLRLKQDGTTKNTSGTLGGTGGWNNWQLSTTDSAYLDAGTRTIRFEVASGNDFYIEEINLKISAPGESDDDDHDGVLDVNDSCPDTPVGTVVESDGCVGDMDDDGVSGANDTCPNTPPNEKTDVNGSGCGPSERDTDGDGVNDSFDAFPSDAAETIDTDDDGIGNNADTDDDGDGVLDVNDAFPLDASESVDTDGDGTGNNADGDDDGDGVADASDTCPLVIGSIDTDLDGICNETDTDDDDDSVLDVDDAFPLDASESVDTDGDGTGNNADGDDDGDGVLDGADWAPLDASESVDTDSDGTGDNADTDDDGDSVLDVNDAFPLDASESVDTDNDGVGNNTDTDDDGDGYADGSDDCPLDPLGYLDTDSDGVCNSTDTDDDGDGTLDINDAFPLDSSEYLDTDGDSVGNNADLDDDGDGVADTSDLFPLDSSESADNDSDGVGDNADTDDDNDGTPDVSDAFPFNSAEDTDTDLDGTGNNADTDDDDDGVHDLVDAFPLDASESVDDDGDGFGNNIDTDDDNDGVADADDLCPSSGQGISVDADGCELQNYSKTFQVEDFTDAYDNSFGNYGYFQTACPNADNSKNVDYQNTDDPADNGIGCVIILTGSNTGEWIELTIDPSISGDYQVVYRIASGTTGGTIQFQTDDGGSTLATTSFDGTGGWANWQNQDDVVSLTAGTQTIRLRFSGNWFNINHFTLNFIPGSSSSSSSSGN